MKKPSIVFLDAATVGFEGEIKAFSELGTYTQHAMTLPAERIARTGGYEIVITNKVVIDREVMDACRELKLVCVAATGMNNIDLEYADKKNIAVKNVSGYSTASVAQSAFSMLFYLMHSSLYYDDYVKSGAYSRSPVFTHHGRQFHELDGKIFGIIGMGNIGKQVAKIAAAFGSEVVYHSTSGKNQKAGFRHLDLPTLMEQSDFISIHCPLNEHTRSLIDREHLLMMKKSAYLLNLGRGGIVDEAALAGALDQDTIAGAALDVLSSEPISEDNPLLKVNNKHKLFITPHIAWASIEARERLINSIAGNIKEFLSS